MDDAEKEMNKQTRIQNSSEKLLVVFTAELPKRKMTTTNEANTFDDDDDPGGSHRR